MAYGARVLLDSVSPAGIRLTTLEVSFPRFVLSEFNTHRVFCLDGETKLYFDLPAAQKNNAPRRFTMSIAELFEKWQRTACESAMRIRSCDEETGEIFYTRVRDVTFSGTQPVYRVRLENGQCIVASKGHRFLTKEGWQRLDDAIGITLGLGTIASWNRTVEFAVNGIPALTDSTRTARAIVRHFVALKSVEYVGERATYDVEVEGPYHNFIADGFVVHNSRNSASSRAIPTAKLIDRVANDPAAPLEWGRNRAGMSASDLLDDEHAAEAERVWLRARDEAVAHTTILMSLGVHKQELNRLLEPFLWQTVIVTSTEWSNFFELRCSPNAQPELREAALRMREAISSSTPQALAHGEWHTPLVQPDEYDLDLEIRRRISVARCARVSYLTHSGTREIEKDLELCERLRSDRHLSPFEHVATPAADDAFHANFRGWVQMRREIEAPPQA